MAVSVKNGAEFECCKCTSEPGGKDALVSAVGSHSGVDRGVLGERVGSGSDRSSGLTHNVDRVLEGREGVVSSEITAGGQSNLNKSSLVRPPSSCSRAFLWSTLAFLSSMVTRILSTWGARSSSEGPRTASMRSVLTR